MPPATARLASIPGLRREVMTKLSGAGIDTLGSFAKALVDRRLRTLLTPEELDHATERISAWSRAN